MTALVSDAIAWIGAVFALGVLACALGAALSRSLFVMAMFVTAAGMFAAGFLLARGAGEGAVAQALFGLGLAPLLLMGLIALTTRAAKPRRAAAPWVAIAAACALCAVLLAATPEIARAANDIDINIDPFVFWIAPLFGVAAAVCLGCLGLGERGAFGGERREP